MKADCIQLEMNFNGSERNRFKENLENGEFQVLAEIDIPSSDTRMQDAVSLNADMEYLVLSRRKTPSALAFINSRTPDETLDAAEFADNLCKSSQDAHLIYLSGRDLTADAIKRSALYALNSGFKNFCAVSGISPDAESARDVSQHRFTESVNILRSLSGTASFTGCTVNPFKYTASDSCIQHFKLFKKFNAGASFAVAQYGFDMAKYQELRWNLSRRALHIPSIARIMYLTPELAMRLCAGTVPGIHISPDFAAILKDEMEYSNAQFDAAQLRRIQILASGAKLLGYSAIQLGGITNPALLATVLDRIDEALAEFNTFEKWRLCWNDYYGRVNMAPYPYRFVMFDGLLETLMPPADGPALRSAPIDPPSPADKFKNTLASKLLAHSLEMPSSDRKLTKKLLASCRSCSKCRLPLTHFICPEQCPRGFANGPCGESAQDGSCRYSKKECIFSKILKFADAELDYASLEETFIDSAD